MSHADRLALVTGAGRGIGRAIAERLAADGFAVALLARSSEQLAAVAGRIAANGGRAEAIPCDVSVPESVAMALARVVDTLGVPSVLVNNAGNAGPTGPIGTADPVEWWRTQEIHLRGALLTMSDIIPRMAAAGGGRIINICSQAGTFVTPNYSSYSVAKSALIRLTEHVDAERRAEGVRAFAIQPGTILTDIAMQALSSPDTRHWAAPLVDLLSIITPDDSDAALRRLQEALSLMAAGCWDDRAGRYLDIERENFVGFTESVER